MDPNEFEEDILARDPKNEKRSEPWEESEKPPRRFIRGQDMYLVRSEHPNRRWKYSIPAWKRFLFARRRRR